ncbi:sugar kinase [Paraoerskovia marina]|uniref:sugar kinase n=1 Tax=Paraoerskovia marina TaxID=545619 RepID=UPI00049277F2|nr:sugar kinase [Paraoerskovia marina]
MSTAPVLTVGETMVLVAGTRHEPLQQGTPMSLGMGGAESNVAIGLRRLGTAAHWVGRVGDDSAGDLVERLLLGEGVQTTCLRDLYAPTGLMLKERRSTMETRVWYYRQASAGSRLAPGDVPDEAVTGAALVHLTGITAALSPSARALTLQVAALAAGSGVPVSFDLNYRAGLWSPDDARALYREILPLCTLVFAGEDEAAIAVGSAPDARTYARRLLDLGAGTAVVKRGADGALSSGPGGTHERPAVPVTVRDTIGAGDAFVAGYLADVVDGQDAATALGTAVAVGAYACTGDGDWEVLPRRREIARLLDPEPVSR